MKRSDAVDLLDRLHEAQNAFYGGGVGSGLADLLTADITWTVPGDSHIAGVYRGREDVFSYFRRRRDFADATFRMHRRDVLVGEGDTVAALTDGSASIGGRDRQWSTVGVYQVTTLQRIAACWLIPLDQREFDSIWSA